MDGSAAPAVVQFGADLREQGEFTSAAVTGPRTGSDVVLLHRLQVNADVRPTSFLRAYLEVGVYAQNGRYGGPSPVDASAPDLHEAFVEWRNADASVQARIGRQEWSLGSGRLVSVRDGPNIRRAFDGGEVRVGSDGASVKALWGRPVVNRVDAFDDRGDRGESLHGVYGVMPWRSVHGSIDVYLLRHRRDEAVFARPVRSERRDSWGIRAAGSRGRLDFNTELVGQRGSTSEGTIRAWTLAHDGGWTLTSRRFTPRIGLKVDVASGDGAPYDGRLGTFNALYPNPSYFSAAAVVAPANLLDVQPNLRLTPSPRFDVSAGWNLLWKQRTADAIYLTPVPLSPVRGSADGRRSIGQQAQVTARWTVSQRLDFEASAVRFFAGSGLRQAGGRDQDFLQFIVNVSY